MAEGENSCNPNMFMSDYITHWVEKFTLQTFKVPVARDQDWCIYLHNLKGIYEAQHMASAQKTFA